MISVCFLKKLPNVYLITQTWILLGMRPVCRYIAHWLKPLQYISSAYRSMCKLNLHFKIVMSIYEMVLWVDGPNIEPTLSPYPPFPHPAVHAGNPPHSPHPRLLARSCPALQKCLAERPSQTKTMTLHMINDNDKNDGNTCSRTQP